jgi:ribosomal protein S2
MSTETITANPPADSTPASALPRVFSKAAKAARAKALEAEQKQAVATYHAKERFREMTQTLGSVVHRRVEDDALLRDPPSVTDVNLELLMANQTHMGHNTSLWNPSNSRFIYGSRQGIHIISLEETAAHLRRAAKVVEAVAYAGGVVGFVGTRRGPIELVTGAAARAGGCHLFTKWTPGAITNRDVILSSARVQVVDHLDRPLEGFQRHLIERRPIAPDLVVCLNPLENYVLLRECGQKNIPTIGIIDTDADPTWVTYSIPANDDR